MVDHLAYELHVFVALLDRAADRFLRAEFDLSYRRFLALLMLDDLGPATQRALADRLGTTEPSVSRMTGVLAQDGLLRVRADPVGGNRRELTLTPRGRRLMSAGSALLEERFGGLVKTSGVSYADYAKATSRMLAVLNDEATGGAA